MIIILKRERRRRTQTDDIGDSPPISVSTSGLPSRRLEVDPIRLNIRLRQRRQIIVITGIDERVAEDETSSQAFFSSPCSYYGAKDQQKQSEDQIHLMVNSECLTLLMLRATNTS